MFNEHFLRSLIFFLTPVSFSVTSLLVQVLIASLIGNPVEIGGEPVAVSGDERRTLPLSSTIRWEGAASRLIRKSEDLPERWG